MGDRSDWKAFATRNGSMLAMLSMAILVGMGEKMAERFLPLYLLALGGSAWSIGFLNAMDNLLSALYSFPGGYPSSSSRRWGSSAICSSSSSRPGRRC